ncbi:MAG: choice-of-anchor U domain-containing protein [Desulfobacterales bacterium]
MLSHPDAEETTFIAPDVSPEGETLVFQVTVEDYSGAQTTDTCMVNVSWVNIPPTADAGADQTAYEGDLVVLDASGSSDPDDAIASFQWTQIEGVPVSLSDAQAMQPAFIAPDTGPEGASLKFSLIVTDQGGLQSTDTCIVNVTWVNLPPTADAGPDQTVYEGETIVLHGENSTDPDDGILSYQWAQLNGTPVTLSDPISDQPTFQAPDTGVDGESLRFQLTVTDNSGLQAQDTCTVNVRPVDYCPDDPNKIDPGVCGCGISDVDTDNDGTPDCIDSCPNDPNKTDPGVNGCGETEPLPVTDGSDSGPEEALEDPALDDENISDMTNADQTDPTSLPEENEEAGIIDDRNDDGVSDRDQANFTALQLNDDQDYVTIESPEGTILQVHNSSGIPSEMFPAVAEDIEFPSGFFEFTVSGVLPDGSITVIMTLPADRYVDTYYKFGKTPDNPVDHWYEFLYDGETGAEIDGNVITLHFVDGRRGDDDLDGTNGVIVDPGGPVLISAIDQAVETAGGDSGSGGCFISSFIH